MSTTRGRAGAQNKKKTNRQRNDRELVLLVHWWGLWALSRTIESVTVPLACLYVRCLFGKLLVAQFLGASGRQAAIEGRRQA